MSPAEIAKLPTEPLYRQKLDRYHRHLADDDLADADAMAAENWNAAVRVCARLAERAGQSALAQAILAQVQPVLDS